MTRFFEFAEEVLAKYSERKAQQDRLKTVWMEVESDVLLMMREYITELAENGGVK